MKKKGFTLVELMVVIAIIGILATVATTSLSSSKARGRDARRASEIKDISLATQKYFQDHFLFPDDLSDLQEYFEGDDYLKDPQENDYEYKLLTTPSKIYYIGTTMEILPSNNVCYVGTDPSTDPGMASNYCEKGP